MEDGKPKRYGNYLFLFHNCSIIKQSADLLKQKSAHSLVYSVALCIEKTPWSFQEIHIKLLWLQ